ncbi:MAG: fluoride efflux transporter CrcB [Candidatus Gastranaerophilales bacterium]|nr:fluoride efflux transporter CrcB [Candidatus Gastranaerophilales bacterium]
MNFLAVFLGGGLGALIRYILYLIMPSYAYLPLATLTANFFGCFFATVVFVYFAMKSDLNPIFKVFLITGFCGGLSTLSALSLELLKFIHSDDYLRAAVYIAVTVIVCTIAVLLGVYVVKHNLG